MEHSPAGRVSGISFWLALTLSIHLTSLIVSASENRPAKLFESFSAYQEGMRGKQVDKPKRRTPPDQRRRLAATATSGESEALAGLAREVALAEARMDKQEWNLALTSLDRAAKSPKLAVASDTAHTVQRLTQAARRKAGEPAGAPGPLPGEMTNSIGMKFVVIPAGSFQMGSTAAEIRRVQSEWSAGEDILKPEQPQHTVRISAPFIIGKYPVTVGQFKRFVEETGYRSVAEKQGWGYAYDEAKKHWVKRAGVSWRSPGAEAWEDHPVTMVCHVDADAYCEWLSRKENRKYFLPTEAQWEYAARGGKEGERFPWGAEYPDGRKLNMADRRSPVPWADRTVDDGSPGASPVGSYDPNGFLLYDMVGNVWQLCYDYYDAKAYEGRSSGGAVDPTGPAKGKKRVVRGGNWAFEAGIARSAFRFAVAPDLSTDVSGFRVAAYAGAGEQPLSRDEPAVSGDSALTSQGLTRLLERVKALTAAGRRHEARRLVDKAVQQMGRRNDSLDDPKGFVKQMLETVIDLTQDTAAQFFTNSLGAKMIRVAPGSFVMGSSESDIAWALAQLAQGVSLSLENEYPFHKVRITRPFFISSTEVTVGQFRQFVEQTGYTTDAEDQGGGQVFNQKDNRFERKEGTSWRSPGWTVSDDHPVTMVSYDDSLAFVEWLTAKEKLPYKLPTEAQWEYACKGIRPTGTFPWGDNPIDGRKANLADRSTAFEWRDRNTDDGHKQVAPVGTYEANSLGLYDMAGNVLEWVRDHYGEDYYRSAPEIDPEGPGYGENRVTKGGDWTSSAASCRCAFRGWSRPDLPFYNTGFRVIADTSSPMKSFHFSDAFLTREWVPGSDQREVAVAVKREKEREAKAPPPLEPPEAAPQQTGVVDPPLHRGVVIIAYTPKSDARRAGLVKGDVIIEYNGVRDLTTDKFLALTAETRKERTNPVVLFVRDGYEYSARLSRGGLGISVMDATVRGPFKRREPEPAPTPTPTPAPREQEKKGTKQPDWT